MATGLFTFLKALLLPLSIALALYFLLSYVLIPLYRRQIARYSNYTPLIPESVRDRLSTYTPSILTNLYHRMSNSLLLHLLLPSTWSTRHRTSTGFNPNSWRTPFEASRHGVNPFLPQQATQEDDDEDLFGEEEGEAMAGFDVEAGRREGDAITQSALISAAVAGHDDSGRRLSRELEEGFRDDSDDEAEDVERPGRVWL